MIGYKNATLFILVMIENFSIITRINKVAFLYPVTTVCKKVYFSIITRINKVAFLYPITTVCKKVWSTVYTMNITNIPPRRKPSVGMINL